VNAPVGPTLSVKLFYSIGQFAQSGGFETALGFVFFYYTAVLGLSGSLVGLALAVSLAFDAAVDPIVGSWSDNVRSRWGRRLPVMLAAAPLMPIAIGLVFAPPHGLSPALLFWWLTVTCVAVRSSISLFNVPYFALGGEMAEDYAERSNVVAFRAVAGIASGVLVTLAAFSVFFTGRAGLQRAGGYPGFGWTVGALTAACSIACVLGLRRYAAALPTAATVASPIWRRLPGELAEMFRNPSFLRLFVSAVVFYVAVGLNGTLGSHAAVFVWKMPSSVIQLLGYGYLAGLLAGVALTPLIAARFEKKTIVMGGLGVVMVVWTILPGLRALGLVMLAGAATTLPLTLNSVIAGVGVGFVAVAYPSMMADAADEHELMMGSRREGLYFAGLGFAGKAASGLGVLVAGFALDFIGFPRDVTHPSAAALGPDVLARLMLVHGPGAAVIGVIAFVIFAPYTITRVRQGEITRALQLRRTSALEIHDGVAPGA
jgi:GPH family glycoside/pentoside/hexuronide:cation symporter